MKKTSYLKDFASELAGLLDIPRPEFDMSPNFKSPTQIGGADLESWTIGIKPDADIRDQVLVVAHEMRHLWQSVNQPDMFAAYQSSAELDKEAYNLQPAEIDANAFALVVMEEAFGVTPLFNGLSDHVKSAIHSRAEEIAAKLF